MAGGRERTTARIRRARKLVGVRVFSALSLSLSLSCVFTEEYRRLLFPIDDGVCTPVPLFAELSNIARWIFRFSIAFVGAKNKAAK